MAFDDDFIAATRHLPPNATSAEVRNTADIDMAGSTIHLHTPGRYIFDVDENMQVKSTYVNTTGQPLTVNGAQVRFQGEPRRVRWWNRIDRFARSLFPQH